MENYDYMQKWQIDQVLDKLPKEEQEKFVKKIMKDLKKIKMKNDVAAIAKQNWKLFGPLAAIEMIGGCIAGALSTGAGTTLDILSAVGLLGSLTSWPIFIMGSIMEDEDGINYCKETSQKAKEQIQYLKEKSKSLSSKGNVTRK